TVLISGAVTGNAIWFIYSSSSTQASNWFIIDGSNQSGGTSRDMTIQNTSTGGAPAIYFYYNADNNVLKNCIIKNNTPYSYCVYLYGYYGDDNNTVQNNQIGDVNNSYLCTYGVYIYCGGYPSYYNTNNV